LPNAGQITFLLPGARTNAMILSFLAIEGRPQPSGKHPTKQYRPTQQKIEESKPTHYPEQLTFPFGYNNLTFGYTCF